MSVSKRIDSSWTDVTIKASREEAYAPIAPQMIAFNGHKEEILSKLREGRGRSARSKPFDEERAWRDISRFAEMHFWSAIGEQATTSPAERFKQLRRVGRTLDRAHTLVSWMMQEDIGCDLFRAWFAVTKIPMASAMSIFDDGSSVATRMADEIQSAVAGIATLSTAAFTAAAANTGPPKAGRPPLLSRDRIQALERVYERNTGSKPGRGSGPFADFVFEVIRAVNPPDFEFLYDSVVDAIKTAHRNIGKIPAS